MDLPPICYDSWIWAWVDVVFLLIWCDAVQSLEFDHLILSWLDAYAWFGGSGARDVLEVCWTSTLDLEKRSTWCSSSWLNAYAWFEEAEHVMFLKLKSWKKVCIFKWPSIFEGSWSLGRLHELDSLLALGRILSGLSEVKNFQPVSNKENSSIYKVHWWALWTWVWLVHGPDSWAQSHRFRLYLVFEFN